MRQLSETLLAYQQKDSAVPCVKLVISNKIMGAVRYDWSRFYTGTEDDYYHALAAPADGSFIRVRVTPLSDSCKLYRQRVVSPGAESDFSQWTYTGRYNVIVAGAAALGNEASILWINSSREIRRFKSVDYGASWGSAELLDYSPSAAVSGIAAAYKTGGDLAIFFADQSTLYVKKNIGGQWQSKAAWDKTTGNLSGVAVIYDGDWHLLVTGQDSAGNYKLWSLVYGDGDEVAAGSWSELKELASAPTGGSYEYRQPCLDKTDVCRCFFVEKFFGSEAYSRPYWSHAVAGTSFLDGLWLEPLPFDLSSEYGLAMTHYGDYAWLSAPDGVWRAPMAEQTLDLSADVFSLRQEVYEMKGALEVELNNDNGKYAAPGQDDVAILDIGCRIAFGPGYVTAEGAEWSDGPCYYLESLEHNRTGGLAGLTLGAYDGWAALDHWEAHHQFRWNKSNSDLCVRDILAVILGRVGLRLEVISQSTAVSGFYPDFTVSPGENGRKVVSALLSFVPDFLFIEGDTAYLVNPLAADSPVYSYGAGHLIYESRYRKEAMDVNRVRVEGDDNGILILADSFDWDEIGAFGDRIEPIEDKNLATVAEAQNRGQAVLRKIEVCTERGRIIVPVNCGQQLYDVIEITDSSSGLDAVSRRVLGMLLVYDPVRAKYNQQLNLGGV